MAGVASWPDYMQYFQALMLTGSDVDDADGTGAWRDGSFFLEQDLSTARAAAPYSGKSAYNPKEVINFRDMSIDSDGRIVSWWWDFGNGYYSDLQNPVFQYYQVGTYIVSLTVTDDDGATDTLEREITVLMPFYTKS